MSDEKTIDKYAAFYASLIADKKEIDVQLFAGKLVKVFSDQSAPMVKKEKNLVNNGLKQNLPPYFLKVNFEKPAALKEFYEETGAKDIPPLKEMNYLNYFHENQHENPFSDTLALKLKSPQADYEDHPHIKSEENKLQELETAFMGLAAAASAAFSSSVEPPPQKAEDDFVGPIKLYNAEQPFVLVNTGRDTPSRGDSHGLLGIAQRVAEMTGARLETICKATLIEMYPDIDNVGDYYASRADVLKRYIAEHGHPDFYFSREAVEEMFTHQDNPTGIIVSSINETLPFSILGSAGIKNYPTELVPHHLTPEELAFQGRLFAEEYADLPRPFIAINLIDPCYESITSKLAGLKDAYPEATFFVCGCHRTEDQALSAFVAALEGGLEGTDGRYPVVPFDFRYHSRHQGAGNFWNPYKGLLDQADHIIQIGGSSSMMSEAASTGKTLHVLGAIYPSNWRAFAKSLDDYKTGEPLETQHYKPIDITADCAAGLIKKHVEHKFARELMPEKKKAEKRYRLF